ncbi:Mor transcription activator family protein [Paraburkholderia sp. BR14263]|uniref:Mor transcription activator family protein n=1 Tax=unclassified Paraburkholderia TaxID=2615204 RepID=UPI0034CEEE5B
MNQPERFSFPPQYPELLEHIGQVIYQKLIEHGLDKQKAGELAFSTAESVRKQISGMHLYIPRGHSYEISLRNAGIFARFKGDNYTQLARETGLTEMQVRNIIRDAIAFDRSTRQQDLF